MSQCDDVRADLAEIVDGDAARLQKHLLHLAGCDDCRDARHAATQAARALPEAGADFAVPEDLEARLARALDERPQPAPVEAPEPSSAAIEPAPKKDSAPAPKEDSEPAQKEDSEPAPKKDSAPARRAPRPVLGRWRWAAAAAAMITAGVLASRHPAPAPASVIARVASGTPASGVEVGRGGAWRTASAGVELTAGMSLRTDERSRARLQLDDGSVLILNRATEVALEPGRHIRLARGELAADVVHQGEDAPARFRLPGGEVEVVGTRFVLSAVDDPASVTVTRGQVRLHGDGGGVVEVSAGQAGYLDRGAPSVAPSTDAARTLRWSELDVAPSRAEEAVVGLGELRARRPGRSDEKERPLSLAYHRVAAHVTGEVSRTEIEESFRNDSGETLEGIYRFPLPPDAQIERLALEVNGKLVEGSFVERDRAAKIWRGVIRQATPKAERKQEEYVWVPGPWRDPALLEWQQGGRFELRIFPIPAHGSRRVILAYTERLPAHGNGRRYVYQLPHSSDGSVQVGRFEAEVRVAGAEAMAHGYAFARSHDAGNTTLRFSEDHFSPRGDLIVDYTPPESGAPLRSWSYRRSGGGDGFVLFSLRPRLPSPQAERAPRDYLIAVDSSQSMVGERYQRVSALAAAVVGEMDPRDRVQLFACDVTCAAAGPMRAPSATAGAEVRRWLAARRPAGASNLEELLRDVPRPEPGHALHVLYLGDGLASVGHRRVGALAQLAEGLARSGEVHVSTVGIGGESDGATLAALARAGGGHYVAYVPGERVEQVALTLLETTWGALLRDVAVSLPPGVIDVAPAQLPNLRAGEELHLAARLRAPIGAAAIDGEVVLRGVLGKEPYEARFPVHLEPSTASGNAFAPRQWAAEAIHQLELDGRVEDRPRIVELSTEYNVMSRQTSLLVLESEAMFQAFGVARARPADAWTGDDAAEGVATRAVTAAEPESPDDSGNDNALLGGLTGGPEKSEKKALGKGGSVGYDKPAHAATKAKRSDDLDDLLTSPSTEHANGSPAAPSTSSTQSPRKEWPFGGEYWRDELGNYRRPMEQRPGRWMRKVYYRVGSVRPADGSGSGDRAAAARAEAALGERPDSRDRHQALVLALGRSGELERAATVAEQWLARDPLDADALAALADVWARQGRRDDGLRLLSGVVDLQPSSVAWQERLARAYESLGAAAPACAHRVALAELATGDAQAVASALACQRALGRGDDQLAIAEDVRLRAERLALPAIAPSSSLPRGELALEASWDRPIDLDVSIISPAGARISFMGGAPSLVADAVTNLEHERLGVRRARVGSYQIEVSRPGAPDGPDALDDRPVRGRLRLRVLGREELVGFTLVGSRAVVARVDVQRLSRLVDY